LSREKKIFELLARPVREVLKELEFTQPTEPQVKAIPLLLEGKNLLIVAPNGSGKTEAALLPIFSRMVEQPENRGISVLYITPLRALNRDMIERLSYWARSLGLIFQVRHGDTDTKTRRRQAINPPDLLVTTPETLQAILPGSRIKEHLSQVQYVIIDEVHHLISNKRGVQLSVGLERLVELVGRDFQRIGLSATLGNVDLAARFLVGVNRSAEVVEVSPKKSYEYSIEYPIPEDSDYDLAEELGSPPEAAARVRRILELVKSHTSTLIFVNSRTNAEMLGHKFNILSDEVAVHHGSLSKDERAEIEDSFKKGILKAIVCTSTMELGIDIGQVDLTVQYLSPRQVSSLIQRVGRSGHRLDLISRGVIITAYAQDVLESLAAVNLARNTKLELLKVHENALDVLAHQTLGMIMDQQEARIDESLNIVKRAYPFRALSKTTFLDVVEYLHTLRELKREGEALKKAKRTRSLYYRNLSMIPDERRYPIVDIISDRRIGTLGDEFMAFRVRVGLNFICRGVVWRIVQIEDETGTVFVVPSEDRFAAIPGWDGEMIPVSVNLAKQVGKIRSEIAKSLRTGNDVKETADAISKRFRVDLEGTLASVEEVDEYLKEQLPLPTHTQILLEAFDRYLVVHACFGEVINRTLGCIFDAVLSGEEQIIGWWNDGYRILIETPVKVDADTLDRIVKLLFKPSDREIDKAFKEYVEARFPFSNKMKFVAERFGALPRGKTLSVERMRELPSRFKGTPIYQETIREAMTEKVDLTAVKGIMRDIKGGRVKVSRVLKLEKPTNLAYPIFTKHLAASELMAPEKIIIDNIEKMKRAVMAKKVNLLCLQCGTSVKGRRVRELPKKVTCQKCDSALLARLLNRQEADVLHRLLKMRRKGEDISTRELEELTYARRTADLVLSYGRKALIALSVRGIGPETASRILGKMHPTTKNLFLDLLKAKITYVRSSPYWKGKKNAKNRLLRGENPQ